MPHGVFALGPQTASSVGTRRLLDRPIVVSAIGSRCMAKATTKKSTAKTSSKKSSAKASPRKASAKRTPKKTTMGRLKDAALSPEMLGAAGIAATGAAIATSPRARRALYEAGVDVADAAGDAANQVKNNAVKLSALIGEAVADAVLRALSGDWPVENKSLGRGTRKSKTGSKRK